MSKKTFFSLLVLAVMGILSIWAFVMSKNMIGQIEISDSEKLGDEQISIKELVITETKDGKKFWEVYADSGQYNNGNNIALLYNIVGNFYQEGNVVLSVVSPKAEYNNDTKEIKLFGGAEAANNKNVFLNAREIRWAGSKNEITAAGNVKIIKEDEGIMTISDKSIFDTDFKNIQLSGDASTYVYPTIYGNLKK